jgi:hypothetical protein
MTMAALTSAQDPNRARTAQAGVIFFAGRIKGQDPSYNFGTQLKTVVAGLNRDVLTAEAQRCGPMLVEAMRELDDAQKTFPHPKPSAGAAPPAWRWRDRFSHAGRTQSGAVDVVGSIPHLRWRREPPPCRRPARFRSRSRRPPAWLRRWRDPSPRTWRRFSRTNLRRSRRTDACG